MEYKVDTKFNINDKLYAMNNLGDISTYHINKIKFKGVSDGNDTDIVILYDIANLENKAIATNINYIEIQKRFFIDKKDILKHIMNQL